MKIRTILAVLMTLIALVSTVYAADRTAEIAASGLDCSRDEERLKAALKVITGVISVEISGGIVSVKFDDAKTSEGSIKDATAKEGFKIQK